jgi:Mg2+/Co2+ transporter CorC
MLTVWMLNRVINDTQEPKERQQLISTMRQAANNPKADHRTLDRINGFLDRLKSEL